MTLQELQNLLRSGKADKAHYKEYALVCHPDLADDPDLARSVFVELQNFMEDKPLCVLRGKIEYVVKRKLCEGTISDLYEGDDFTLKVALSRKEGKYITNEFDILTKLKTDKVYQRLLPIPQELLKIDNRDAAVYKVEKPLAPLTHWGKLDPRHIAWITKRTLMALGYAHSCGYVHGSIDASHILINYESHGITLCGWSFGGKIGATPGKLPKVEGRPADFACDTSSDIYMACFTLREAINGASPLRKFFDACLLPKKAGRPSSAWDLHDELNECLGRLFGKPTFTHLSF